MRSAFQYWRLVQPFAAYSLTQQSLILAGFPFHWLQPLALLMFTGAFMAYNYFRAGLVMRWLSVSVFIFILMTMNPPLLFLLMLALLAMLTWIYLCGESESMPSVFHIRKVPGLKTIMLCFIWTMATAVIPLASHTTEKHTGMEAGIRFLFLFPVIIASDRLDFEKDKAAGVLSLPVVIGEKKTIWLTALFLLLYLSFAVFIYLPFFAFPVFSVAGRLIMAAAIVTGSLCLAKLRSKRLHRILLDLSVSFLFMMLMVDG